MFILSALIRNYPCQFHYLDILELRSSTVVSVVNAMCQISSGLSLSKHFSKIPDKINVHFAHCTQSLYTFTNTHSSTRSAHVIRLKQPQPLFDVHYVTHRILEGRVAASSVTCAKTVDLLCCKDKMSRGTDLSF